MCGNTTEVGHVGGSPEKSSLFFLTAYAPWNRIARREGEMAGKAS
jgi:hypothetical protein